MSNIADRTRSRTINPSLLSINNMNTNPIEYSNDNVNDPQHQYYSDRGDTEQNVDPTYHPGDLVFIKQLGKRLKFGELYLGPYKVIQKEHPLT
ncbi:unnamed protein product [Didymodactylos carnosus]|uniref:Uncharacterized protein n=1 Tax=Didymodactylos carnosus TaxID=1234261 RepID=A0A815H8Y2_9BILA|nr:unnamed protein product [Didymodactylos carnosus]CAF1351207.1 unnamed protein product [Didymodactylos carnosus]CAF3756751.1 unnamed protein product [Didymodactylos carnosus]CAF4221345.1 unnamed protein product [Didymodactylos carnosus]